MYIFIQGSMCFFVFSSTMLYLKSHKSNNSRFINNINIVKQMNMIPDLKILQTNSRFVGQYLIYKFSSKLICLL